MPDISRWSELQAQTTGKRTLRAFEDPSCVRVCRSVDRTAFNRDSPEILHHGDAALRAIQFS